MQQKVDEWFTHHAPSPDQADKYAAVRHLAKQLAFKILEVTPAGPSQDAAVLELRKAVMLANAAIANGGAR